MKLMTVVWTAAATAATAAAGGVATDPESACTGGCANRTGSRPPSPSRWSGQRSTSDLAVSSAVALDSNDVPDIPGGRTAEQESAPTGVLCREPRPQCRVELALLA